MNTKNPFRNKPSTNGQNAVEDWGKSKFKPTTFKSGNKNHKGKYGDRKDHFQSNKEKFRFNEVARDAKPENATPWNKYKEEILFKQQDEEHVARQANMESNHAKSALRQRDINYRKSLVVQKKTEATEWEDFGEGAADEKDYKLYTNGIETQHEKKPSKKFQFQKERKVHAQSCTKFKKNMSKKSTIKKDFISKDLLNNFDSKKLNYEQNDRLRQVITATTIWANQSSLQSVVNNMKKKSKIKNQMVLK